MSRTVYEIREAHPERPAGIPWLLILEGLFLVYAIAILVHTGRGPYLQTLSVTFVGILLEAFPFMLIGALAGGFIEEFVSEERIAAILPRGKRRTVFLAAGMGMLFPVCECAIVPVVRRLIHKGAPLSAAVAFLLGGPIVNPIVLASTVVAYGVDWRTGAIRLLAGYVIAVAIGFSMGRLFRKSPALLSENALPDDHTGCACCGHEQSTHAGKGSRIASALAHAAEDFFQIGHFLVIGAFIAATIHTTVDRTVFLFFSEWPSLSILMMMSLALALNLCSEADAFVASSFQYLVPFSSQMAFMVLGPMLDVKLLLMYLGLFRKRAIAALSGMTLVAVFGAMMLLHAMMHWISL